MRHTVSIIVVMTNKQLPCTVFDSYLQQEDFTNNNNNKLAQNKRKKRQWLYQCSVAPCKGIRNPESNIFWLLESGILGFGIRNPVPGNRNPTSSIIMESRSGMYYIQRSNLYVRERNTWYLNHFSLEQCLGESLEVLCNVHVATFKFRNRVVCLFRKSPFINEAAN